MTGMHTTDGVPGIATAAGATVFPWESDRPDPALTLPRHIRLVLVRTHAAEQTTRGPRRREAFRTMRILIGGALDAGYPSSVIAECLGVSRDSLRSRAEPGSELSLAAMEGVGLDPEALARLGHPTIFGEPRTGEDGVPFYSAADIIRGLATLR